MKTILAISLLLLLQGCAVTVGTKARDPFGGYMLCVPCISNPEGDIGFGIGFDLDEPPWFIFQWED